MKTTIFYTKQFFNFFYKSTLKNLFTKFLELFFCCNKITTRVVAFTAIFANVKVFDDDYVPLDHFDYENCKAAWDLWKKPLVFYKEVPKRPGEPTWLHVVSEGKTYIVIEADGEKYEMLHHPLVLQDMCKNAGVDYAEMQQLSHEMWLDVVIRDAYRSFEENYCLILSMRSLCNSFFNAKKAWDELRPLPPKFEPLSDLVYSSSDIFLVFFIIILIIFALFNINKIYSYKWTNLIIFLSVLV